MRPSGVIGWLPLVLLTACVASHTGEHQAGTVRPTVDRLLNRGDIQVAESAFADFGFDPGPVDGIYTAQTQAAVRAFQARYGLRSRDCSIVDPPGAEGWGGLHKDGGVGSSSVSGASSDETKLRDL